MHVKSCLFVLSCLVLSVCVGCVCVCVEVWGVCVIEGEVVGAVWGRDELGFRGCVFWGGWGENCEWLHMYVCCSKHPDSLVLCSILFTTIAQKGHFCFSLIPCLIHIKCFEIPVSW